MIRAVASVAWLGMSLSAVHARTPTNPAPSSLPDSGFDFVRIDEVSASRTLARAPMQFSRSLRRQEAAGAAGAV
jgi:hypothetical protein